MAFIMLYCFSIHSLCNTVSALLDLCLSDGNIAKNAPFGCECGPMHNNNSSRDWTVAAELEKTTYQVKQIGLKIQPGYVGVWGPRGGGECWWTRAPKYLQLVDCSCDYAFQGVLVSTELHAVGLIHCHLTHSGHHAASHAPQPDLVIIHLHSDC